MTELCAKPRTGLRSWLIVAALASCTSSTLAFQSCAGILSSPVVQVAQTALKPCRAALAGGRGVASLGMLQSGPAHAVEQVPAERYRRGVRVPTVALGTQREGADAGAVAAERESSEEASGASRYWEWKEGWRIHYTEAGPSDGVPVVHPAPRRRGVPPRLTRGGASGAGSPLRVRDRGGDALRAQRGGARERGPPRLHDGLHGAGEVVADAGPRAGRRDGPRGLSVGFRPGRRRRDRRRGAHVRVPAELTSPPRPPPAARLCGPRRAC